jgi:hypothetical protein
VAKSIRPTVLSNSGVVASVFMGAVLLGCSPGQGKEEEPPSKGIDARLFMRDQPTLRRIVEWNGRIIVEADRPYTLDFDRATLKPLEVPGAQEVLGVASNGPGKPLALCKTKAGLSLLAKQDDKWVERELPDEAQKSAKPFLLCADPASVAVVGQETVFSLARGKWKAVPLKDRPKHVYTEGAARHALLAGEALYLGYDKGEWGGGLLRLDLGTGKCKEIDLGEPGNVRDLKTGPGERLWVVQGLDHLTLEEGAVQSTDGKEWAVVCRSSKGDTHKWDLSPTSLDALAFDVKGNPWLLSGTLGLIRREKEKWVRVTPDWPEYLPVRSLHITPGGVAVIGTFDAGVVLFEVESKRARRVTFPK